MKKSRCCIKTDGRADFEKVNDTFKILREHKEGTAKYTQSIHTGATVILIY